MSVHGNGAPGPRGRPLARNRIIQYVGSSLLRISLHIMTAQGLRGWADANFTHDSHSVVGLTDI
jgi:hypothetical protein